MQGGLTFLFWGYKEQNKPNIALEWLSTSNGTATFLSTVNINQIYNLYFRSSSYSGFIILSALRPLHTHTHTHTEREQKKIFLEDMLSMAGQGLICKGSVAVFQWFYSYWYKK